MEDCRKKRDVLILEHQGIEMGAMKEIVKYKNMTYFPENPFNKNPKWLKKLIDDGVVWIDESTSKLYLNDEGADIEVKPGTYMSWDPEIKKVHLI